MEWFDHKECSICCDDFSEGETVYKLPCKCEYLYHDSCVETHFSEESKRNKNKSCPLCSTVLEYENIVKTTFSLKTSYDWITLDGRE